MRTSKRGGSMKRSLLVLILLCAIARPASSEEIAHDGWKFLAVRQETAPRSWIVRGDNGYQLGVAGTGDRAMDGRCVRLLPAPGGKHVLFSARYRAKDVQPPRRSIVTSVVWLDDKGRQVDQAEFPLIVP